MQASAETPIPSLHMYQLRLPVFEGPLDVLLRLIEREQLPISEISLLAVCDQFLTFTNALNAAPPGVIAEFAVVAGRLSLLKSRALLPQPPKAVEDPDEIDLVRQLDEYRAVKNAAALLADRQRSGQGVYGRGEGVATPPPNTLPLPPQPPSALSRAMKRWLSRVPAEPVAVPMRAAVTLREMIDRVMAALRWEPSLPFERLSATCQSRQDVVVAFLAVLTLLRRQRISVVQDELFGPIAILRADSTAGGTLATEGGSTIDGEWDAHESVS